MGSLFSVFAQNDEIAVDLFNEGFASGMSGRNTYGCFANYLYIYEEQKPNDKFYVGYKFPFWYMKAIEEINSKFSNISIRFVKESIQSVYNIRGSFYTKTGLEKTVQMYKNHVESSKSENTIKYYKKYMDEYQQALDKGPTTIPYALLEISNSSDYSKSSDIIIKKLIAIMLRMITLNFGFLTNEDAQKEHDSYLELISNGTKRDGADNWLSISEVPITEQHLLNLDDTELVNEASKNIVFDSGYSIKQTDFIRDVHTLKIVREENDKREKVQQGSILA